MTGITKRTGALASAVILLAVSLGAGITGATAQEQFAAAAPQTVPEATATLSPETPSDDQPRFVSQPVVQEVPELVEESATETDDDATNAASLRELVSSIEVSDQLSPDMQCLAQAVYFESRGEPLSGQLAVAQVVINRAESSLFPDDYCSVVTQRAQFSFVRAGAIPAPKTSSAAWQKAKAIARIAHQDLWHSEADDALYFHAHSVKPRWARSKTARATIDSHIFYR